MEKGVILAGGRGTRLAPATYTQNKHLLPIINIPMIFYPLATMKHFGVKKVLIITGGNHIGNFTDFLGDGFEYGLDLTYRVQEEAGGIAQALSLAEDFVGDTQHFMVVLGDNIFEPSLFRSPFVFPPSGSNHLFLYRSQNNKRFGVPVFSGETILEIEEKPEKPQSEYAVTGMYLYPREVFSIIKLLHPSARGEYEITDVNNVFIRKNQTQYTLLDEKDGFWSDCGTPESMIQTINWASKNEYCPYRALNE